MEPIDPRVDLAFKKIFGVEENKDLLISLVNSIVGVEDQVKNVTLLNPYNPKNFSQDKLSILDIKAEGEGGKRYNIEIQISDEADYDKRALYYWAKLYTEQLETGKDYAFLSKAIGIHILNFMSILENEKYHNKFHITEKEAGFPYFKDLELHTIELKKFSKNTKEGLDDMLVKVKDSLDMWVAFLTRRDLLNKDNLPPKLDNPALKKAIHVLDVMSFGVEEREAYESHLKWLRIEANTLRKYEAKGFAKGEQIGLQKGEKKLEKKLQEERRVIARNLLKRGMDKQAVADATGLSLEEVASLES